VSRWPWITTIVAALFFLNPVGLEIVGSAIRYSNLDWLRDLWVMISIGGVLLVIAIGLAEWAIRTKISRQRSASALSDRSSRE